MVELLKRLDCPKRSVSSKTVLFPIRQRLLYAINHAISFSSNGYAVRSHEISKALVQAGIEVIAITRPGFPWDRAVYRDTEISNENLISGVRYIHLPQPRQTDKSIPEYLNLATEKASEAIRLFRPQTIIAASNWHNALPWALAARSAHLPFFYEVRGFWEISRAAREPDWTGSAGYLEAVRGETAVAKAADKVFTINRHMRNELIRRGVDAERIELVPNGFPSPQPTKVGPTRIELGIQTRYVVGYIGSFNDYEGIEDLIEAVARLRTRAVDVSLLLVGSSTQAAGISPEVCAESIKYKALANQFGIADYIYLPGRVAPQLVSAYYNLLNVVVIPRRPVAVCELVSPIKPLEAASYGKPVLLSDVEPLADIAKISTIFSTFSKGSIDSLTEKLYKLLAANRISTYTNEICDKYSWINTIKPIVQSL